MADVDALLAQLTLDEKSDLCNGSGTWTIPGVSRLGVPSIKVTDGPAGARGDGLLGSGTRTLCVPCGIALGATWDPALVERLGAAIGDQARSKGSTVLLAPTINLHRSPVGGRNFECYAEDPHLAGTVAAGFVRGVQSRRVATTPKHLVANDQEFERNTIDTIVDQRALRELYLRPFELAVVEGGAWGLMAAYNRLNGVFCTEHPWLLTEVLRGEWGFDGVVVSDWFATRSTVASAVAGLDLEMPGPGAWYGGGKLAEAVRVGEMPEAALDALARRLLVLIDRVGGFEEPLDHTEHELDRPEDRALARQAAADATVLLRNDGILPLDVDALTSLAVIGPNAARAMILGGGSAALEPFHRTGPLAALEARLGDRVDIAHERGCVTDRSIPELLLPLDVEVYAGHDLTGERVADRRFTSTRAVFFGPPYAGGLPDEFSARGRATFVAAEAGTHTFSLVQMGRSRLFVDGELRVDGWTGDVPRGEEFFGLGSEPLTVDVDLGAGEAVELVVEYANRDTVLLAGFTLGCRLPERDDLLDRAVAAAAAADVALVIVGTNDDWETEGRDRESMDLPGDQDELVRRVAAATPRTVVVVNAGSPVTMDWADDVAAVLDVWFGGQEMADALVDVLTGAAEPAGRLPTTFPLRLTHTPAFVNFPGENGQVRYGEGVFLGYRWYDATDREVRFPFGHGGSYTSFDIGPPSVSTGTVAVADLAAGAEVVVEVEVTNTGVRRGAEVVQCYVAPRAPRLARPPKELKAYGKIRLDPGETATVRLVLGERAFACFDPGDPDTERLRAGIPVPAGGGDQRRTEPAWVVDPGAYDLVIGVSAADIRHTATLEIT